MVITEILSEAVHEISAEPLTYAIELVQFAILIVIIKAVAFGFGKRRGVLVNMVAERRERVAAQVATAEERESAAASAPAEAARVSEEARAEGERILAEARAEAARERERILAQGTSESAELERQAADALVHERAEVLGGVREGLLDVVTQATRQVLDEGYSAKEQRTMIEGAILASLDDLESVSLS